MEFVALGALVALLLVGFVLLRPGGSVTRHPPTAPGGTQGFDVWPFF